ncbi:MAG: hypothetical protein MJ166_03415 [Clostridia bacterium]|nr:hypothetical protein [Clostridia bacterium]
MEPKNYIAIGVLAAIFIVIGIIAGKSSKKENVKTEAAAKALMEKRVAGTDTWFITSDNKVVYYLTAQSRHMLTVFNLEEVGYFMPYKQSGVKYYSFYDANKKPIKCTNTIGDKVKNGKTHFVIAKEEPGLWKILSEAKSDIKLVGPYFKEPQV